MHAIEAAQILAAGAAAGAINALVGSGTLVTFPVLLALGYPPVVANASNTVGLVPGSFAAAYGYRAEVAAQRRLLLPLGAAAVAGAIGGALLLLVLPEATFGAVVPVLISLALVLIILQPWIVRALRRRTAGGPRPVGPALIGAVFAAGVYGGYFGAALGVLLLGVLGILVSPNLQQVNGLKNIIAGLANTVAAVVFVAAGVVEWLPALLIALGSVAGGMLGARYGRRLPDAALRAVIVAVGLTAVIRMVA
ncbi:sulfite exporter TauE/SafE family protein [Actinoplanes flavus]|uniref:Probable membrane transporter protein n=1 Tax=Actinoplanes flavus TaxID=2820290 RepID=A0ABS3UVJ0_9ACTN|nr:sulfite exporter TauE/SafE family protein [Actinoplanes flavus]MBO3742557.1 sulfite exporter TauE/SafE family protein [Actinoplanes flavus]